MRLRAYQVALLLALIAIDVAVAQHGLKGEYYHGLDFEYHVLTRTDARIDFSRRLQGAAPGIRPEYFSIRWTGSIYAPVTGLYNFYALTDDGMRVWVADKQIIDGWVDQEETLYAGSIMLEGSKWYNIRVEYYNSIVHSVAKLEWELPPETFEQFGNTVQAGRVRAVIPSKHLSPNPAPPTGDFNVMVANVRETPHPAPPVVETRRQSTPRPRPVTTYKTDEAIALATVIFDQSKSDLRVESFRELDKLSGYLKRNPTYSIRIIGHTDYAGDSSENLLLSEQRAKAVATYLIKSGIPEARVFSRGMGERTPLLIHNKKDRSVNRRVEFVLTKNSP